MTNEIIQAVQAAIGATGWQGQVGAAAGVCVLTILGGVIGWFGKVLQVNRKAKKCLPN